MRKETFAPGEHYHIFGRGVAKQPLFYDKRDYARFLFLVIYFQAPITIHNVGDIVSGFVKNTHFSIARITEEKVLNERKVALISFTFMPNHFHLIIEELGGGGVSQYMHKVLTAYAKYFSQKYKTSGHVFQGPFRAVHIETNRQLLHTSAYVHRNQREILEWRDREDQYSWSSYQDYVAKDRWGKLLKKGILLGQFKNKKEYKHFVETSGAKETYFK